MRLNILAFVFGTGLLQQQAKLPEVMWAWGLMAIIIVIGWLWRRQSAVLVATTRILWWIFFLGVGFFWAAAFAHWRLADFLSPEWERQDIQIVGIIASLPQENDRNMRFQFHVEHVVTEGATVPKRIALSWYKSRQPNTNKMALPVIKVGQRWQMTVRLKQPHGNANPHGFDYEVYSMI